MFTNAGTSRLTRFWEDDLRQRIGFVGRTNAFTDEDCMFRAMRLFINFFAKHFQYGGYCFLVTLPVRAGGRARPENERIRSRCFETIQNPAFFLVSYLELFPNSERYLISI